MNFRCIDSLYRSSTAASECTWKCRWKRQRYQKWNPPKHWLSVSRKKNLTVSIWLLWYEADFLLTPRWALSHGSGDYDLKGGAADNISLTSLTSSIYNIYTFIFYRSFSGSPGCHLQQSPGEGAASVSWTINHRITCSNKPSYAVTVTTVVSAE